MIVAFKRCEFAPLAFLVLFATGLVQEAFAQANQSSSEAGFVYDIQTQTARPLNPGSQSVAPPSSADGTGALASDTSLSEAELIELAETEAYYAPYEEDDANNDPARRDADGNFIPFSVIKRDTRRVVINTTNRPARSVVQIRFGKEGSFGKFGCTGAFISSNVILTAGHCVFSRNSWHKEFTVYPGRNGAIKPFGKCTAKRLYSVAGWLRPDPERDARFYDLGAIELDCDVGEQTGWFAMAAMPDDPANKNTVINGYPCDKTPAGRQWESSDKARELTPLKVFYKNDTFGCMSGSPVFLGDDRNTIYAVHTNGLHGEKPWKKNNAGTRLTEERIANLMAWIGE